MICITEKSIQDDLYHYLRAHGCWPIFPNMNCITMYEADLIVITKAGYAHEYEIKLSLSDFRADLKKEHKHASLSGNVKEVPNPYSWEETKTVHVLPNVNQNCPWGVKGRCYPDLRPKNFWYVVSGFDVPETEIPAYAGLMVREEKPLHSMFKIIKKAPPLKAQVVNEKRIRHAEMNMLFRYWNMRLERTGKAGDKL